MEDSRQLIVTFYTAFQNRDVKAMLDCYHPDSRFSDPVFGDLNSEEVKAMWSMLIDASADLKTEFCDVRQNTSGVTCRWDAWYTFSSTGRKVHNIIHASFQLRDGLIYRHHDRFDLWRWTRMALGVSGVLLGWTPVIRNKIRNTARMRLQKFMKK